MRSNLSTAKKKVIYFDTGSKAREEEQNETMKCHVFLKFSMENFTGI
jgi:hypothetical protein